MMMKHIGNFYYDDSKLTPLEEALRDDTLEHYLTEQGDIDIEDIDSDFLEVQDFDTAMEEIKNEIDSWDEKED